MERKTDATTSTEKIVKKSSPKKKTKVEDNIKAVKFNEFLVDNDINAFSSESMDDDGNTVLFRSRIEVGGQILPTVVIIDSSTA